MGWFTSSDGKSKVKVSTDKYDNSQRYERITPVGSGGSHTHEVTKITSAGECKTFSFGENSSKSD